MLKRSNRSASIRISLNQNGDVVVSAPRLVPQFLIDRFVANNQSWIERQRRKIGLRKTVYPSFNWDENIVSYLGQLYLIKVDANNRGEKVEFINGTCTVRPVTGQVVDAKKTLLHWLKNHAEHYILHRVVEWAKTMGVSFGTVRFGQQTSRWGSCSGDNNLRFNWRLIHFPAAVIDYVVIHELAHTIHHDHSPQFWQVVSRYCPDWKSQRRYLRNQSISIESI